jgi:ArsR family transcriptional regulator
MDKEFLLIFKALSDRHRHRMLEILCEQGELCVSDICKNFKMTQPSISHHLAILKRADVVKGRKIGKEVYYSVNKGMIRKSLIEYFVELKLTVE